MAIMECFLAEAVYENLETSLSLLSVQNIPKRLNPIP